MDMGLAGIAGGWGGPRHKAGVTKERQVAAYRHLFDPVDDNPVT